MRSTRKTQKSFSLMTMSFMVGQKNRGGASFSAFLFYVFLNLSDCFLPLNLRHTFDQKRLKQPLYRHPWEDVLYTK